MNNHASKLARAFGKTPAFMPFIMGGDPDLPTTEKLLHALHQAGVALIEIGIPFSDPVAEGATIEAAATRALTNGCTVDKLFNLIARAKKDIPIPLLFRTYYNPIFVYGAAKFARRCVECGIEGLIVPDLPLEEMSELREALNGTVVLIPLLATASPTRAKKIAAAAEGFVYCLSTANETTTHTLAEIKKARHIPCVVSVDATDAEEIKRTASVADGVAVSNAIVELVATHGQACVAPVAALMAEVKASTK